MFYGPRGKAESLRVPLHLTLNPYHCSCAFQPTDAHAPLHIGREQLILELSNQLLESLALTFQPVVSVNLGNQRAITELAERLIHTVMPHIVSLKKPK
jgi:hypothetical protein